MRCEAILASCILAIFGASAVSVRAQGEPHPAKAWRAMTMIDLRLIGPSQSPTARLWHDRIAVSSSPTSSRLPPGGRSATAANVVIRSPDVVVMLSILHADRTCDSRPVAPEVWRCAMRLVRFDARGTTIREGTACFAHGAGRPEAPGAYASYDASTRMVRLGVLAGREAVEGCSQSVPVRGE